MQRLSLPFILFSVTVRRFSFLKHICLAFHLIRNVVSFQSHRIRPGSHRAEGVPSLPCNSLTTRSIPMSPAPGLHVHTSEYWAQNHRKRHWFSLLLWIYPALRCMARSPLGQAGFSPALFSYPSQLQWLRKAVINIRPRWAISGMIHLNMLTLCCHFQQIKSPETKHASSSKNQQLGLFHERKRGLKGLSGSMMRVPFRVWYTLWPPPGQHLSPWCPICLVVSTKQTDYRQLTCSIPDYHLLWLEAWTQFKE